MALFKRNKQEEDGSEMSFIDHLEALRWHLVRSVIAVVVCAIIIFVYAREVVSIIIMGPARNDFATYSVLCNLGHKLKLGNVLCLGEFTIKFQSNAMTEQFMTTFHHCFCRGLYCCLPLRILGVLEFCKTRPQQKRNKENTGYYLLGICIVFYGRGVWLLCTNAFYGEFLF